MSDHMEIGDTGLVATEYGFYDVNSEQKLDHNGKPLGDEDADSTEED